MKSFLITILASMTLGLTSLAAPAMAGTHTGGHVAGTSIACTPYNYDWGVKFSGNPQYGHADWEQNCGNTLRVLIYCEDGSGQVYHLLSGPVTSLETNTQIDCHHSSLNTDQIQAMYTQVNSANFVRHWARSQVVLTAATRSTPPVPAPNHNQIARVGSTYDWCNQQSGLCWRDPSDGGAGVAVLDSLDSASNALDWALQSNGTCGGTITATCPGGWISANLPGRGFVPVTLRNIGQGKLCLGASGASIWDATMRTCDGVGGITHLDTVYAYGAGACGSAISTIFYSFQWNSGHSAPGIIADNNSGPNGNVMVLASVAHCLDGLWNPIGS